jgi:hypothetical protein
MGLNNNARHWYFEYASQNGIYQEIQMPEETSGLTFSIDNFKKVVNALRY